MTRVISKKYFLIIDKKYGLSNVIYNKLHSAILFELILQIFTFIHFKYFTLENVIFLLNYIFDQLFRYFLVE